MDLLATHRSDSEGAECPSRYQLELYLAEELPEDVSAKVETHSRGCSRCAQLLNACRADNDAFFERHSFESFYQSLEQLVEKSEALETALENNATLPATETRQASDASRKLQQKDNKVFSWMKSWGDLLSSWSASLRSPLPLGAVMAVLALLTVGPLLLEEYVDAPDTPQGVRLRSGIIAPGALEVYLLRAGEAGPALSGHVFLEGDRLQFVLHPGSYRYLHLVSFDAEGRLTWFYPQDGGTSLALPPGNDVFLPGSIELDDYVGLERIEAVFSRKPISEQVVRDAYEAMKAGRELPLPLDRMPPVAVEDALSRTFLMVKE